MYNFCDGSNFLVNTVILFTEEERILRIILLHKMMAYKVLKWGFLPPFFAKIFILTNYFWFEEEVSHRKKIGEKWVFALWYAWQGGWRGKNWGWTKWQININKHHSRQTLFKMSHYFCYHQRRAIWFKFLCFWKNDTILKNDLSLLCNIREYAITHDQPKPICKCPQPKYDSF